MASRAERRIDRPLPWPAFALALLAIAFFAAAAGAHAVRYGAMSVLTAKAERSPSAEAVDRSVRHGMSIVSAFTGVAVMRRRRHRSSSAHCARCRWCRHPVVGGVALLFARSSSLLGQWLDCWSDAPPPRPVS